MSDLFLTTREYVVRDVEPMRARGLIRRTFMPTSVAVHEWHSSGELEVEIRGHIMRRNGKLSRRWTGDAFFDLGPNGIPEGWPQWLVELVTGVSGKAARKLTNGSEA